MTPGGSASRGVTVADDTGWICQPRCHSGQCRRGSVLIADRALRPPPVPPPPPADSPPRHRRVFISREWRQCGVHRTLSVTARYAPRLHPARHPVATGTPSHPARRPRCPYQATRYRGRNSAVRGGRCTGWRRQGRWLKNGARKV